MTFVLRMALREIRASWQRLLFFFVCIAIGVASIVAIRSVIQSVRATLAGEARALIASDAMVVEQPAVDRAGAAARSAEAEASGRIDVALARPSRCRRWCGRAGADATDHQDGGAARGAGRVPVLRAR